jgi:hypothetical protein
MPSSLLTMLGRWEGVAELVRPARMLEPHQQSDHEHASDCPCTRTHEDASPRYGARHPCNHVGWLRDVAAAVPNV